MSKGRFHDIHVELVLEGVQAMDEIGGPDTLREYIAVLEEVQADINKRLATAKARIATGEV